MITSAQKKTVLYFVTGTNFNQQFPLHCFHNRISSKTAILNSMACSIQLSLCFTIYFLVYFRKQVILF